MLKIEVEGREIIKDVKIANTYLKRLKGFMFLDKPDCGALVITPCSSIHTYFMKFNIDVLFVNEDSVVVDKFINISKNKMISPKKKAKFVIEASANTFTDIKENENITICDDEEKI